MNKINKVVALIIAAVLCLSLTAYVSLGARAEIAENEARIIITFDDNQPLLTVQQNALPIMNNYGFEAIVFPYTNETNEIWFQVLIQSFISSNWEIGCHTHTHPHLNNVSSEQLQYEIEQPKQILESTFPNINNGLGIITFAYPFGEGWRNATVDSLVAETFDFVRPPAGPWQKYPYDNPGCWGRTFSTSFDDTCIAKTQEAISFVRTENVWAWLMFHGVSDDIQTRYVSVKNFTACLQLIVDSGIQVATMKDLCAPASYPVASFIHEPSEPVVNETVTFNASTSYDSDGSVVSYFWNFGDGINATESEPIATNAYKNPGTYTVTLTVTDNDGQNNTVTKYVNVGKLNSTISISASPTTITIGDYTTTNGSITPTRAEVNATIWFRVYGEETWNVLTNVTTDENSQYIYDWAPSEPGAYELKASWTGDNYTLPAETSTITLTCLKISTSVSISTSCSSTFVGFKVNVTGMLQDDHGNSLRDETVVLYYTFSGIIDWFPITSDTTDDLGNYFAMWVPPATGYFEIKAEWAGNMTHLMANNTTTLSSLPYQNQFVFSVESNSTISDLAFNTTDWKLSFTTTGPNVTTGYVKVTIAKSLVSNIANIKVYLDGNQTEFLATSTDDSWLLSFTYSHSTHQVAVDLDINIIPEFPTWASMLFILIVLIAASAIYKRR